jgi:hypothetical protein
MIRILTLLVSLFSFGLVQLAEITYEIPVTDMLYFNDTPITELNGLTLNEVFRDSNLSIIDEFTFTSGSQRATLVNDNIDIDNTLYMVVNLPIQMISRIRNRFEIVLIDNTVIGSGDSPNIGIKSFIYTNTLIIDRIVYWGNTIVPSPYTYKNATVINLTTLGLTSLSKSNLDKYFELWLNPELNITYEINTLDTQDLIILLASQSVWTIMIHLLYKYAYRPKKKSKRLGM